MKTTPLQSQDILRGFHGLLDLHGFEKRDVEDILRHAESAGVTDGDDARREFCKHLSDGTCPHE